MAQLNALRPITQRLNLTPVADLPQCAAYLAAAISNCRELLKSSEGQQKDESVQVHKLITRISSLLQDKTQEGRFTGVVLVKALIEVIQPQTLAKSGSVWVRSLLSCLNRNDPPQVKKLSVITITRIFLLSRDSQAMVREVTTPSLAPFLTACLNLIKPTVTSKGGVDRQVQSSLLQPVLECWLRLLRAFPSTFRPYVNSIRTTVLSLIGQQTMSQEIIDLASRVYAGLHFCAPKDNSASEWTQSIRLVIEATHQTADLIFRSVLEEWSPITPRQKLPITGRKVAHEVQASEPDAVGLGKWVGIQTGCSRAVQLFRLLDAVLTSQHAQAVRVPLAEVLDLTARFASVFAPSETYSLRDNKEIGRDEREELFMNLPRMHKAVLQLYEHIASVLGRALIPVSRALLSQLWDISESGSSSDVVRTSLYNTLEQLLVQNTISLRSTDSDYIASLVRKCIADIQSADGQQSDSQGGRKESQNGALNVDLHQQPKLEVDHDQYQSQTAQAAWSLLPVMLSCVPTVLFTSKIRTEIDRVAILLGHEKALLASVINPPPRKNATKAPSVIPFLARMTDGRLASEALLKPRMPTLQAADQQVMTDGPEEVGSSLGETDVSPDTNLDAVEDQVIKQLKDDSTQDTPDQLAIKKREHTAVEEATSPSLATSIKRARIAVHEDVNDVQLDPQARSGEQDTTPQSLHLTNAEGNLEDGTPVSTMHIAENPVIMNSETASASTLMQRRVGQEDDSDDSDIPQIDTALSSDDEDEDDEI